ncbi:hypothetical protein NQ117_05295 [Paenibacillus sp. SC116]|uniref:phage scaffolding protein n=1 Tax=Paenibacillus sp. SC116 TaxID=2968986 RepID=UPI00215A92FA|nr:hypothetical protein [Paenibacillus sp. SC116]MCR8843087.1 hypothetical protein [Paenibacillus sp. SC116]
MTNEMKRYSRTLNLQMFAEPDPEPPLDPQDEPKPEPEKTFTQTELDEIVSKRIERERKKYVDYDELKTKLDEFQSAEDERKRGEMTEIERLMSDLANEQSAKQTLESEYAALRESVKNTHIRNTFEKAAASANIEYVDDAWKLASESGIDVSVGKDGKTVDGIDALVTWLVTNKSYLVAKAPNKPKQIGGPPPDTQDTVRTLEAQLEDAKKKKDFSKVIEISNKIKGIFN